MQQGQPTMEQMRQMQEQMYLIADEFNPSFKKKKVPSNAVKSDLLLQPLI